MFRSAEITQPAPARPRRRSGATVRRLLVVAALLVVAGGTGGAGVAHGAAPAPNTPNRCIQLNGGDVTACNVGNRGRGDLPYRRVTTEPNTPDRCIQLNGGDLNACNVGNSGRGDRPYLPAR